MTPSHLLVPWHTPDIHLSFLVVLSSLSHAGSSGFAGCEQSLVFSSHCPALWHASMAVHVIPSHLLWAHLSVPMFDKQLLSPQEQHGVVAPIVEHSSWVKPWPS